MTGWLSLHNILFVLLAFTAVASSTMIMILNNLLHSAVALFFTLTSVAGLFLLLSADFLGMAQVLVYAGGILVLIIFGIFLTSHYVSSSRQVWRSVSTWLTIGVSLLFFQFVVAFILDTPWVIQEAQTVNTIKPIGNLLLTHYLLPFELISLVLLFVLLGSIVLIRKEFTSK
jgi:NADH-quinone oxidoreductase subunit J